MNTDVTVTTQILPPLKRMLQTSALHLSFPSCFLGDGYVFAHVIVSTMIGSNNYKVFRRCLRHNLCSQPYGSKSILRSTGSAV
jgi:hypothetical protein